MQAKAPAHPFPGGRAGTIQRIIDQNELKAGQFPTAVTRLSQALAAGAEGKALWDRCAASADINLVFKEDNTLAPTQAASTRFLIEGKDINADTDDDIGAFNRAGKIDIVVGLNPNWNKKDDLGACTETVAHEFALHAVPHLELIDALRDAKLQAPDLNARYTRMKEVGGSLDSGYHHHTLARGTSSAFNDVIEHLRTLLSAGEVRSLMAEMAEDINDHRKDGEIDYKRLQDSRKLAPVTKHGSGGAPALPAASASAAAPAAAPSTAVVRAPADAKRAVVDIEELTDIAVDLDALLQQRPAAQPIMKDLAQQMWGLKLETIPLGQWAGKVMVGAYRFHGKKAKMAALVLKELLGSLNRRT